MNIEKNYKSIAKFVTKSALKKRNLLQTLLLNLLQNSLQSHYIAETKLWQNWIETIMSTRLFLYVRTKKKKKTYKKRYKIGYKIRTKKKIQKQYKKRYIWIPFIIMGKYLKLVYSTKPIEPVVEYRINLQNLVSCGSSHLLLGNRLHKH